LLAKQFATPLIRANPSPEAGLGAHTLPEPTADRRVSKNILRLHGKTDQAAGKTRQDRLRRSLI
jgi:hypothetical protein